MVFSDKARYMVWRGLAAVCRLFIIDTTLRPSPGTVKYTMYMWPLCVLSWSQCPVPSAVNSKPNTAKRPPTRGLWPSHSYLALDGQNGKVITLNNLTVGTSTYTLALTLLGFMFPSLIVKDIYAFSKSCVAAIRAQRHWLKCLLNG